MHRRVMVPAIRWMQRFFEDYRKTKKLHYSSVISTIVVVRMKNQTIMIVSQQKSETLKLWTCVCRTQYLQLMYRYCCEWFKE